MSDLRNILSHNEELSNEELLRYLEGKASEEERHAIEKKMADSDFVNDAVEGLQQFPSTREVRYLTEQLNRQLNKETASTQLKKRRRGIKEQPWTLVAIVAVLLLCVLGFFVIRIYREKHKTPQQVVQPANK
jgi:ferric-dicitrate binding protein FerR (iron transport regulator)